MTDTELFLDKYKWLEQAATVRFHLEQDGRAISQLERMPRFRSERNTLSYARDVRNLLQHNPKIDGEDAVTPSKGLIDFLDKMLRRVENPEKCLDSAIVMGKLYYKGLSDEVYPAMETMAKRSYSHVPILKNGVVTGVFSKNSIFALIMSGKTTGDLKKLRFADITEYTKTESECSDIYVFARDDMLIEDAEELCEETYKNGHKIGLLFLTKNGRAEEKLTAAITPWTILGRKF